ncbi:fasciclin-3 isoform X2 [Folsomia candida]|uniref:fasciclin-3 isoform X2 n=1 Tax=Folsomia candida TaxID=158441 RepID=UPI000B9056AF|nr:fasciclin-3 isoform X2 [Folsomia candida]
MWKISKSWIVLVVLAGISSTLAQVPQQAQVPNHHINARRGVPSNFSCESQGTPISYCIWERPADPTKNLSVIYLEFSGDTRPGQQSKKPGYFLTGDGLDKGQCGLKINRVEDTDNGVWQCTLLTSSGSQRGQVHLSILQKPSAPQYVNNVEPMYEDTKTIQPEKITCYSTNGVPRPKFQWFIGDEQITSDLSPLNETTAGNSLYTFQELRNHRFSFKDHGKKLRCVVVHEALSDTDMKEVLMNIEVRYRPRSVRSDGREVDRGIGIQADLGEEKVILLNVSSNPPPRVVWVVDGKQLEQGTNTELFEAIPMRHVAPSVYEVALKIKSVDDEVLTKRIELKVSNDLGVADYVININSSSSDGLSAGGILGIVLAILVLIILIAVGVVYTRARGLLCFKGDDGTASEKERMDGDSTGVAATAEEKPATQGFGARLSALYENLVKKKDKGAAVPVDEEAPKEKDSKEKDGEGGGDSKDPEKKGDDIVYAELDLARSAAESQRPEVRDDKTEYAEIVGVVSKDDSAKKTPEASPKK